MLEFPNQHNSTEEPERNAPNYIQLAPSDYSGLRMPSNGGAAMPYGLAPRDFFRTIEDTHTLLYDLNNMLFEKQYNRFEEMLDPAAYSGLISKTISERLARQSKNLVVNQHHNGYPDLLIAGQYSNNATAHGTSGIEVKASRHATSWQAHGPRAGWFCVVQFSMDLREDIALYDKEPTKIVAMMVANLTLDDWTHYPAKENKIRSGTATINASGMVKCRTGAVWVSPEYEETHQALLKKAKEDLFREKAQEVVAETLANEKQALSFDELYNKATFPIIIDKAAAEKILKATLKSMAKSSKVQVERTDKAVPLFSLPHTVKEPSLFLDL